MAEYNSSYTGAQIDSAVAKAHSHTGNITESGTLQTTDVTIADGDKLVVTDASDGNKVARASVSFNGTTTTKALTQKGTFETFARPSDLPTTMVASGTGHAGGLVPDPPETAGTLKYLREDGTWQEPGNGATMSVVAISVNTSSVCSITGAGNSGKSETIIYTNSGSSDKTVTVPTTYKTPDGQAIELTCPAGGYCEVSYLNISGTIYARGL